MGNNSPAALARRTMTQVQNASVKRILKDIVGVQPELVREAIIEGLSAPPPRSFPYIALAASYLDGKPVDAPPNPDGKADLSELTRDQLLARAMHIAKQLERDYTSDLPVIDVLPEREPTLEELQAEVVRAEEEVRLAQEELRKLTEDRQ